MLIFLGVDLDYYCTRFTTVSVISCLSIPHWLLGSHVRTRTDLSNQQTHKPWHNDKWPEKPQDFTKKRWLPGAFAVAYDMTSEMLLYKCSFFWNLLRPTFHITLHHDNLKGCIEISKIPKES